MIKLGLIGKNIQHSLSPAIYKKIFGPGVSYDLLDFQSETDIPPVAEIFQSYDGINITSPYKKHFLSQVELTENARELGAINCLKKNGDKIIGENTDYLAIVDILKNWLAKEKKLNVVLFGDGVMASVTEAALKNLGLTYKAYSRKKTPAFSQLNLKEAHNQTDGTLLVINTCAREFVFDGILPKECIFWDYNYNFEPHHKLSSGIKLYQDGREMLELQAQYAVAFWSFIKDSFK